MPSEHKHSLGWGLSLSLEDLRGDLHHALFEHARQLGRRACPPKAGEPGRDHFLAVATVVGPYGWGSDTHYVNETRENRVLGKAARPGQDGSSAYFLQIG